MNKYKPLIEIVLFIIVSASVATPFFRWLLIKDTGKNVTLRDSFFWSLCIVSSMY